MAWRAPWGTGNRIGAVAKSGETWWGSQSSHGKIHGLSNHVPWCQTIFHDFQQHSMMSNNFPMSSNDFCMIEAGYMIESKNGSFLQRNMAVPIGTMVPSHERFWVCLYGIFQQPHTIWAWHTSLLFFYSQASGTWGFKCAMKIFIRNLGMDVAMKTIGV